MASNNGPKQLGAGYFSTHRKSRYDVKFIAVLRFTVLSGMSSSRGWVKESTPGGDKIPTTRNCFFLNLSESIHHNFLYEHHAAVQKTHVLNLIVPKRNWQRPILEG